MIRGFNKCKAITGLITKKQPDQKSPKKGASQNKFKFAGLKKKLTEASINNESIDEFS